MLEGHKNQNFVIAFQQLDDDCQLPEVLLNTLELEVFTCNLYGSRKSTVNEARYKLFMRKYTKGNKVIDLALLSPCKTSFNLHLQQCNYIAHIWRCSGLTETTVPFLVNMDGISTLI